MQSIRTPISPNLTKLKPQSINKNIVYVRKNQTIQSVIDSITDESATNPYIVIIPPGLYQEKVVLADYISIQGAGINSTIITGDGSNTGIEIANECTISNLTVDGVTYEGSGYDCMWSIGCDDTHSNETVYIYNCGFYTKSSYVHIEGSNIAYVYNCIGKSVWDIYVGIDTAKIYIWNCYSELYYHETNPVKTAYLVQDDAVIKVWSSDVYMNETDQGVNTYGAQSFVTTGTTTGTIYLYDCVIDLTATDGSGEMGGVRVAGTNRKIYVQGGRITLSYTNGERAGIATYGGTLEMYNVDINKRLRGSLTNPGTLQGFPLQKVNRGTMSGNETFGASDGTLFIRDPGAARNFNPVDTYFLDGTIVTLINIADAAETITFDSGDLNQAVAQNERGIFAYHKTDGWMKVYVGS